ncbi:RagB/SusD family nutrient uptake outer membrane protein [Flavobacterium sp. '19STA2R22 D10 B1']|uniref:RagB/SusD family nutrient uptake outer membrane protein n=1 Tax=Flavobacterium aerium TaxID=3037261 RepID=UPI00278C7A44|nr:RagB/SusD family nutrient uptake outer membrane protein [Flavobacterium sp. '19STA2R22 D10 B1']
MKKIFIIIAVLTLSLQQIGCSTDYLDEPKPTQNIEPEVIFSNREGVNAFMAGILRLSRGQFYNNEGAGLQSIYFARSVRGNALIQKQIWFGDDYDFQNREATYTRPIFTWRFTYKIIDQLNNLIKGVENSPQLSETDKRETRSQALALRGFYYFQLALEFGDAYQSSKNLEFPPIYTESTSKGRPMSTKTEFFNQILSDLETAAQELPASRTDKSYVNNHVAQAFLAQVYQYVGDWDKAKTAAINAYGGNPSVVLKAADYNQGFNDINKTEWLWGLPQSNDQTAYYMSHPHAMMDHVAVAYHGTFVNNDFVNLFSSTDVRNLFSNLYNAPVGNWQQYVTSKFKFTFDADIPLIRYPEMILIEAEAEFHLGNQTKARELLDAIRLNRDTEAQPSTASGNALIEQILTERRKEFYGENGVEWYDAKRLLRGITRTGNHRTLINLNTDDKRFELKIPQEEIDANTNIPANINANR